MSCRVARHLRVWVFRSLFEVPESKKCLNLPGNHNQRHVTDSSTSQCWKASFKVWMLQDSRAHSSNLHSRESMNTNATNNPKQKKKTRPAEVSLNEWVYSPYFIVIDCETTGLDPSIGRIILQLSAQSICLPLAPDLPPSGWVLWRNRC